MTDDPDLRTVAATHVRPTRIRVSLTRAGRVVAVVAIAALVAGWADLGLGFSAGAATAGAGLVVAAFASLWAASAIRIEPPGRMLAFAGEPSLASLRISNASRRGSAFDLRLRMTDATDGRVRATGFVPRVAAGAAETADLCLTAARRGRWPQDAVVVESSFPLGLVRTSLTFALHGDVLVLPRPGVLRRAIDDPARTRVGVVHGNARRGDEQEIRGLRDWREGESLRHVHWKLTARRGRRVAREFGGEPLPRVHVVVVSVVETRSPGLVAAFEEAVVVAATIVDHYLRRGLDVRLTIAGASVRTDECGRGRNGLAAALAQLAEVTPDAAAATPAPQLSRLLRRGERTFVVRSGGTAGDDVSGRAGGSIRVIDVTTAASAGLVERVARVSDDAALGVRR